MGEGVSKHKPELPGGPMPRWQLFDNRVKQDNMESVGFRDPEGNYYHLIDGEEVVHIKSDSEAGRDTFIRESDGTLIPFEEFKQKYDPEERLAKLENPAN